MKSFAFAALSTAAASAAISADKLEFINYTAKFNKVYDDVEEFMNRLERFIYWDRLINEHNNTNGPNFHLGHNQFSDWSDEEYKAILGTKVPGTNQKDRRNVELFDNSDLPESLDWPWQH